MIISSILAQAVDPAAKLEAKAASVTRLMVAALVVTIIGLLIVKFVKSGARLTVLVVFALAAGLALLIANNPYVLQGAAAWVNPF